MALLSAPSLLQRTWSVYAQRLRAFAEPLAWLIAFNILFVFSPFLRLDAVMLALLSMVQSLVLVWASVRMIDTAWTLYTGQAPSESLTRTLSWGKLGRLADALLLSLLLSSILYLGYIAFVLPMFVLLLWFGFSMHAFLLEGTAPGTASLARSFELVRGQFLSVLWRAIALVLAVFFASLVLVGVVALIALAVGQYPMLFGAQPLWAQLVLALGTTFIAPFFITGTVVLFAEARKPR